MTAIRDEALALIRRTVRRSSPEAQPHREDDMPLDADLLELLACPSDDHAPLREETRDGADVLVCTYCASSFPSRTASRCCCSTRPRPGRTAWVPRRR